MLFNHSYLFVVLLPQVAPKTKVNNPPPPSISHGSMGVMLKVVITIQKYARAAIV